MSDIRWAKVNNEPYEYAIARGEFGDEFIADPAGGSVRRACWQPIETAPKDGTEILLYRNDCGVFLGRWDAAVSFMTETECEASEMTDDELHECDWWGADFVQGYRVSNDGMPTHWQPLPEPPHA